MLAWFVLILGPEDRGISSVGGEVKRVELVTGDRSAYAWPHADRWLSVDEIAAYLGIKRDTVYKWIAEKQMPAHRMGRLWKFRKEEVDHWVKSGGAGDNEEGQPPGGRK